MVSEDFAFNHASEPDLGGLGEAYMGLTKDELAYILRKRTPNPRQFA